MDRKLKAEFKTSSYYAKLNLRAGNIVKLRCASDAEEINLANVDDAFGFGNLATTRRDLPPYQDDKLWSPLKLKSWQLKESCEYASAVQIEERAVKLENPLSGHGILYEFAEEFFDVTLKGDLPDADQCGLAFPMAFMDLRQADPLENQLLPGTLHTTVERDLTYAFLQRPKGKGILFTALTPCAGWRVLYDTKWSLRALQLLARFDSRFDASGFNLGSVHLKIRVSFPKDYEEAMKMVQEYTNLPLLDSPSLYRGVGEEIPLRVKGEAAKLLAFNPAGESQEIPMKKLADGSLLAKTVLTQEGFWRFKAMNAKGHGGDLTVKAALPALTLLERARSINKPSLGGNAEDSYWAQAFCAFRNALPPDKRMDDFLHNELVDIWMQGLPFHGEPVAPAPETARRNLAPKPVKSTLIPVKEAGFYTSAPCPEAHNFRGRTFSLFHLFKNERIQDAFSMIQTFLYAADAFSNDLLYEQAVRIAEAHLKDHLDASGRLQCLRDDNLPVDYTTVITPLVSLIELLREMRRREDSRAAKLEAVCLRIADYLLARGFEFPTEGAPAHMRWTEDGSIACTALSLFHSYLHLSGDKRYLARAVEVMDFHKTWTFQTSDVRSDGASFRYWETKWENDGEGNAINAGHAWNIWQAEALFYQGVLTNDPKALWLSWRGYCANLAKFMADGRTSGCFTPDYLPQRPPRLELCHRYPEHVDESLAFYVWPRMKETWCETSVAIEPALLGFPSEFGPVALNGALEKKPDGSLVFKTHASNFKRLLKFGKLPEILKT